MMTLPLAMLIAWATLRLLDSFIDFIRFGMSSIKEKNTVGNVAETIFVIVLIFCHSQILLER